MFPRPRAQAPGARLRNLPGGMVFLRTRASGIGGYATHPPYCQRQADSYGFSPAVFPLPRRRSTGGRGYATHRADGVPSHTRASGIGGYATHLTSSGKHTRMISWQCSPFPDAEAPGGGVTQPTRQTVFPAAPAQAGPEVTQPIWTRAVFPTAPLRLAAGRRLRNLPGGWRSQPLERAGDEWRLRDPTGCSG